MDVPFRCDECGVETEIEELATGAVATKECCHNGFVAWASTINNKAKLAIFIRHRRLLQNAAETLNKMADDSITSADPQLRAAAQRWRQENPR